MIRGTHAPFTFKLPYQGKEVQWVTIKFWQNINNNALTIIKRKEHCELPDDSYELYVELDPAETMKFSDKLKAKVQLRGQALNGRIFGSHEKFITVYPMNDEIIEGDDELPGANEDGWVILDGSTIA